MKIDNTIAITNFNNHDLKINTLDEKRLKESTDAFEAFLVKKVLDISLKNENSIFGKDAGDNIYNSMYNDTMSKALSGNFGFSELLFNFLKDELKS